MTQCENSSTKVIPPDSDARGRVNADLRSEAKVRTISLLIVRLGDEP